MVRIAVCDDNEIQKQFLIDNLQDYIEETNADFLNIYSYTNPVELLESVNTGKSFDICILDLIMPEMFGIDLAKGIRKALSKTKIIFLSSSADFVFQSFEVDTFDYLLKPVESEKLYSVLDRAIEDIVREREDARKTREELVANISHEIRTPLTVISGYAQRMKAKINNNPELSGLNDLNGSLSNITNETAKLGSIISQFTDKASHKADLHTLSLYGMRHDISMTCSIILQNNRNTLYIDIPSDLPEITGNKELVLQILKNLMLFINEHYKDSEVCIRTKNSTDNNTVSLIIYDNSKDQLEQSIENIVETGWSTNGGSAISMDICYDIMQQMNGKMKIGKSSDDSTIIELNFQNSNGGKLV